MTNNEKRALLETTVQVDRKKTGGRRQHIENEISSYNWKFSTQIVLLEFKATIIQECITIYNDLRQTQSFTQTRDRLIESYHSQSRLRAHIFNNIVCLNGGSFEIKPTEDSRLAEQAAVLLSVAIPRLYTWFKNSVDVVLSPIACDRAEEPPKKNRVAYEPLIPICIRNKNKKCSVENVLRSAGVEVVSQLNKIEHDSVQLSRAKELVDHVAADMNADICHRECRKAGDLLIALEARDSVTHIVSANTKEWKPLCQAIGVVFHEIRYPATTAKMRTHLPPNP